MARRIAWTIEVGLGGIASPLLWDMMCRCDAIYGHAFAEGYKKAAHKVLTPWALEHGVLGRTSEDGERQRLWDVIVPLLEEQRNGPADNTPSSRERIDWLVEKKWTRQRPLRRKIGDKIKVVLGQMENIACVAGEIDGELFIENDGELFIENDDWQQGCIRNSGIDELAWEAWELLHMLATSDYHEMRVACGEGD